MNPIPHAHSSSVGLIAAAVLSAVSAFYIAAGVRSSRRCKRWPLSRYLCWMCGAVCAAAAVTGPLPRQAHADFTAHMFVHLLLGMIAPLLLALAAPMTLALRTLPATASRKLVRLLKSRPLRIAGNPLAASLLNVGGLWVLYTTDLYAVMQHSALLHGFVHLHLLLAGYLFTVSIIANEPAVHRTGFVYRAIVFWLALAGHGILAKRLYAFPPPGVSAAQAEAGGMLMYYGGDALELAVFAIFCRQWFHASRPRVSSASG